MKSNKIWSTSRPNRIQKPADVAPSALACLMRAPGALAPAHFGERGPAAGAATFRDAVPKPIRPRPHELRPVELLRLLRRFLARDGLRLGVAHAVAGRRLSNACWAARKSKRNRSWHNSWRVDITPKLRRCPVACWRSPSDLASCSSWGNISMYGNALRSFPKAPNSKRPRCFPNTQRFAATKGRPRSTIDAANPSC